MTNVSFRSSVVFFRERSFLVIEEACKNQRLTPAQQSQSCSFCTACALHVLQAVKASGSFNGLKTHDHTGRHGQPGGASKDEGVWDFHEMTSQTDAFISPVDFIFFIE